MHKDFFQNEKKEGGSVGALPFIWTRCLRSFFRYDLYRIADDTGDQNMISAYRIEIVQNEPTRSDECINFDLDHGLKQ